MKTFPSKGVLHYSGDMENAAPRSEGQLGMPDTVFDCFRSAQVIEFLRHLRRHLNRKLLVIWDGSKPHRSRLVKDFVVSQNGAIAVERLPAYAPELNPVEYIWGYWKHHELPNFCPKTFSELSYHAIKALKRMRRRPTLITAFWHQAELF